MNQNTFLKKIVLITALFFVFSCTKIKEVVNPVDSSFVSSKSDIVWKWNELFLKTDSHVPGYRPPIAARALAYMNILRYESIASQFKEHQSIASTIGFPDLTQPEVTKEYHWGVVLNTTSSFAMKGFIQTMNEQDFKSIDSLAKTFDDIFKTECDSLVFKRSKDFALALYKNVYTYSLSDGQSSAFRNNKPTDYIPPVGIDKWKSTPPDNLLALAPRWGAVRTFAIQSQDRVMPDPIPFSVEPSSEFYKQGKEVYDAFKNPTSEQRWMAEFWSDDASTFTIDAASRQYSILTQLLKNKKESVENSLVLCAKLSVLLHDASVACWDNKFKYNLLRPYSYITENISKDFKTMLRDPTKPAGQQEGVTPQHPSYPSGHSVYAQGAAEIFINQWGDKNTFTDFAPEGKRNYYDMRPRTYKSFTAMSQENAYSRIYLGVHYRMDCDQGLALGKKVGTRINSLPWTKVAI